jgi:hypothetical protein
MPMTHLTSWLARGRYQRRAAYIRSYTFPNELRRRLGVKHPAWPGAQVDEAIEGLRAFFLACLAAQREGDFTLDVPSQAIDDAWHEFILMTREYTGFCRNAYGRYLHHAPEGTFGRPRKESAYAAFCGASLGMAGDSCGHAGHGSGGHGSHGAGGHGGCGSSGHGCGASCGGGGGCSSG